MENQYIDPTGRTGCEFCNITKGDKKIISFDLYAVRDLMTLNKDGCYYSSQERRKPLYCPMCCTQLRPDTEQDESALQDVIEGEDV